MMIVEMDVSWNDGVAFEMLCNIIHSNDAVIVMLLFVVLFDRCNLCMAPVTSSRSRMTTKF